MPPAALDRLAATGVVRPRRARAARVRPDLVPEARAYALTSGDGDGPALLRRRERATVAVAGLGRTGATLAAALAAAGVGTLVLDDPGTVRAGDLAAGLAPADVGRPRVRAVGDLLARTAPHVRVRRPGQAAADVTVLVSADVTDPGTALDLLAAGAPHLPVVLREADALVGPFVLPGADGDGRPCLRCVDLHRTEADPAWPAVLAQLTGRRRPVAGPPAALAAVAAGLAAAEVLAHVDGGAPRTLGAQYEIPLPGVEPRVRRWAAHPDCGCAALPA
ncbi:ThiF family adenylyltransferase [Cellulomonas hominis]|nr:ThiF family adenylyltransferase [Cellulomonas hominis]